MFGSSCWIVGVGRYHRLSMFVDDLSFEGCWCLKVVGRRMVVAYCLFAGNV